MTIHFQRWNHISLARKISEEPAWRWLASRRRTVFRWKSWWTEWSPVVERSRSVNARSSTSAWSQSVPAYQTTPSPGSPPVSLTAIRRSLIDRTSITDWLALTQWYAWIHRSFVAKVFCIRSPKQDAVKEKADFVPGAATLRSQLNNVV